MTLDFDLVLKEDALRLDCRIPGHKMANLKHCYRGAAVVLSRCARSPVIVKPSHKIAILKHCYRITAVVL